jgi:hypothetical protein
MRRRWVEFTLLIALMVVVPSAQADTLPEPANDDPSDVATVWFDTLYEVVKSEAPAFAAASRTTTSPVVQSVDHAAGVNLHKTRWAMATVRTATCCGKEVDPTTRHPRRY